jgi:hypothetical protein
MRRPATCGRTMRTLSFPRIKSHDVGIFVRDMPRCRHDGPLIAATPISTANRVYEDGEWCVANRISLSVSRKSSTGGRRAALRCPLISGRSRHNSPKEARDGGEFQLTHHLRGNSPTTTLPKKYPPRRRGSPLVRPTCRHCGSAAVRTIPVPWYPELDYLSCDQCHHVWTIKRASPKSKDP